MTVNSDLGEGLDDVLDPSLLLLKAFDLPSVDLEDFDVGVLGNDRAEQLGVIHLFKDGAGLLVVKLGLALICLL